MTVLAASCGPDTAWEVSSTLSQRANRKVRDVPAIVSAQVEAGGGLPPRPHRRDGCTASELRYLASSRLSLAMSRGSRT